MKKTTAFFLVFLTVLSSASSASILVILPTPSLSHQIYFQGYVADLAARGHHMTIITANEFKSLKSNSNVTQIVLSESYKVMRNKINSITFSRLPDEATTIDASLIVLKSYLEHQLKNFEVAKLIENRMKKTFDVIVLEHSVNHPYLAFSEVFNAPIIAISTSEVSNDIHQSFGNIYNPLIHADSIFPFAHDGDMTFHERWQSFKFYVKMKLFTASKYRKVYNELIRTHFPTVEKNVDDLQARIHLLLINTSPVMGYSRPMLPNVIQIGSMHVEPRSVLRDEKLKKFLDESTNGVIVVNLGSLMQSKDLSLELKNSFIEIIQNSTYGFLWKFETDFMNGKLSNLMTVRRIQQQSDVLAHSNVKLFITHGGKLSIEEAIDRAVPMIVIPSTAEETANAHRLVKRNVAYHLELCKMNGETLRDAIEKVVGNSTMKQSIEILRQRMNDKPMTGRDTAVWWTEYIVRHRESSTFEYPGKLVPFYVRFGLDFIGLALLIFVVTFFALRFLFRRIVAKEAAKLAKLKIN